MWTVWGQFGNDVAMQEAARTWLWNSERDYSTAELAEHARVVMEILWTSETIPPDTEYNICVCTCTFYDNTNVNQNDTHITSGKTVVHVL